MQNDREEVRRLAGASEDEIVDVLVSCDGTWQKRGFSSLFGVVFVIAHITIMLCQRFVLDASTGNCKTTALLSISSGGKITPAGAP